MSAGSGTLRVWEIATGALLVKLDQGVTSAAFSGSGDRIVTAVDGIVTERPVEGSTGTGAVAGLAWGLDGRWPFVVGRDVLAGRQGFDLVVVSRDGTAVARWPDAPRGWEGAFAVTNDAAFAIAEEWLGDRTTPSNAGHVLLRFEPERPGPVATFRASEMQSEWDGDIQLSPDGKRLAAVFPDSVRILDAATLALRATVASEAGAVVWSPDGRYIATTPNLHYRDPGKTPVVLSKTVRLWDAASGRLAARFDTPTYAAAVAFDETGARLRGWGTDIEVTSAGEFIQIHTVGESIAFDVDLLTGAAAAISQRPFVGSARELVAVGASISRISTGAPVSTLMAGQAPTRVLFSGDLSIALALGEWTTDVYAVLDGHLVAEGPPFATHRDQAAVSADGRRVLLQANIYCLR